MKKYILTLALASTLPLYAMSQSPAGRVPKTVVADVLAQMPSKDATIYNNMMRDIVESGPEAISVLVGMMGSPTSESNAPIEYAIDGLSYYVTKPSMEKARKDVTAAYIKAIESTSDRDIKAFFFNQLGITAKDDAIEIAKKYAVDSQFTNEAVKLLVNIGSPAAAKVIDELAEKIPSKATAAKAIGDLKVSSREPLLVSWLNTTDLKEKQTILYALSQCGNEATLPVLSKEAAAVGYNFENTYATNAYLTLLDKVDPKVAAKSAAKLLKADSHDVRSAALVLLAEAYPEKMTSYVIKSLSDESRGYRNSALSLLNGAASKESSVSIVAKLDKYNDDTKEDVINWLKANNLKEHAGAVAKYVTSSNPTLAKSAMSMLVKTGDMKNIANVTNVLIKGGDNSKIAFEAIEWAPVNTYEELLKSYPTATDNGKVLILNLFKNKRYNAAADLVIAELKASNADVKKAAYVALAYVADQPKYFDQLCSILESTSKEDAVYVQSAIGNQVLAMKDGTTAIKARYEKAAQASKPLYFAIFPQTGAEELFAILVKESASSDKNNKNAAVQAITSWNGYNALTSLYNIVLDNSLEPFHKSAVERYTNIVNKSDAKAERKLLELRKMLDAVKTAPLQNIVLTSIANCPVFNSILVAGKYLDNEATCPAAGNVIMRVALANKQFNGPEIIEILNKFVATRKGGDAPYDIEAVKKHINAINADKGYEAIFNGKDLSGWKGLVANPIARAKMDAAKLAEAQAKADEVMRNGWKVENGTLIFTGKGDNLCTEKKYGDFEMYVDWMITPEGDAGIYLRGTPQVQIWDTSRVDVGAQVGSGGLYNNSKNPSKPLVLADSRIGDWNTFYIKMVGERVTVILNGEKVVDNVILENYWNRNLPIFPVEQLELQAHGTHLAYRDVYVRELEAVKPFELSDQEKKDGFKMLFDGTSMHEWTGNTKDYTVEDGTISLNPKNGGGGNLYTKNQYKDFEYRFEFQLTPGANNGLGIRTPMEGDAAYVGMELQILDSEHPIYKDLQEYQYHGSVYGVIPAKRGFLKPMGEWNYQEVIVKGNKIKIILNGETIVDGDIAQASKNGTLDKKDHPGLKNASGHIAFLGHGSPVKFKNIRIKEL